MKKGQVVAGCYCAYQDKILLLKRHPSKFDGGTWCIPGGKCEEGETPLATVIREMYEEIGVAVEISHLQQWESFAIKLPDVQYTFHVFRTRFLTKPLIYLTLDEHTEARWVTIKEAFQLPLIRSGSEILVQYQKIMEE